jgi:hypothetical protein
MPVVTQVQVRRGTASQWTSANPTLASGEWGFETDTLKTKIGNGSTAWNSLAYATGSVSISNVTGLGTGVETFLATPSSANLRTAVTDETGTGSLVFATSPTITTPTLDDPKINLAFDAETASYTAILTNNGQVVTMNVGSANTFSIPTNASVAFPIGTQINVLQIGTGQTTIQAVTSGTTSILSTGASAAAPKLRARYSAATCLKAGTDLWYVFGDIA